MLNWAGTLLSTLYITHFFLSQKMKSIANFFLDHLKCIKRSVSKMQINFKTAELSQPALHASSQIIDWAVGTGVQGMGTGLL